MNLVGIAVALFLASGLGSDSIGLLCDGIRHVLSISFGNASLLYNLLIIVAAFIVAKENLGLGTVVYALVSGYFIDFYGYVIELLKVNENIMAVRILSFIIGTMLSESWTGDINSAKIRNECTGCGTV